MKFPGGEFFVFSFFMIGVTLWAIAGYIYWSYQRVVKNGIETKGIVIGLHFVNRYERTQAPSVRYVTQTGQTLVYHSGEGRNPPAYQVGEEVTVYYDPQKPTDIRLAGNFLMVYVMGGIGAVFLLLTVWEIVPCVTAIWKWAFFK